jgi:uncharacterized protein (DUF2062 family)
VFSHSVRAQITILLDRHIGPHASHAIAAGVSQGAGVSAGLAHLPAQTRPVAVHAVRVAFVSGLNEIFTIGGILSLISAVLTLVLIRNRDFEVGAAHGPQAAATAHLAAGQATAEPAQP